MQKNNSLRVAVPRRVAPPTLAQHGARVPAVCAPVHLLPVWRVPGLLRGSAVDLREPRRELVVRGRRALRVRAIRGRRDEPVIARDDGPPLARGGRVARNEELLREPHLRVEEREAVVLREHLHDPEHVD
jgi:hypothetical protein